MSRDEARHSPLPWRVEMGETFGGAVVADSIIDANGGEVVNVWLSSDADAEFTVRAVNAHHELLAALKEFIEWGAMTSSDRDLFTARFQALIAKAEGREP